MKAYIENNGEVLIEWTNIPTLLPRSGERLQIEGNDYLVTQLVWHFEPDHNYLTILTTLL